MPAPAGRIRFPEAASSLLIPGCDDGMQHTGETRRQIMMVVMALMGWGLFLLVGSLFGSVFLGET